MKAPKAKSKVARAASPAKQLAGFLAKYDPPVARLARAARAIMRAQWPAAIEQVYDNYQFLAIGYCSTERTSDCLASLAVSPHGVALSFYYGATLPDPKGVLLGEGRQNRYLRLPTAAYLKTPVVQALLRAAMKQAKTPLALGGKGYTLIKSISAKQRPRRLAKRAEA